MSKSRYHFIALFIAIVIPSFVLAQDKQEQKEEILRLDTSLASVDISITNKSGSKVTSNLKREDFVIYEDGVRQKVENFYTTEIPFNVVLLVDTSGSTKDDIELIKKAGKRFLDEMRPQDKIAIIEFNQKVNVLEELTTDRNKLDLALDWIQSGTGTSFYDAVHTAISDVLSKAEGRKAIVALTDGVDSDGGDTYDDLLPLIEKSKTALYFLELDTEAITEAGMMRECEDEKSFHFSHKQLKKYIEDYAEGVDTSKYQDHCQIPRLERMQINRRLYESAKKEIKEISSQTGGEIYPCKRLRDIGPAFTQIATELRTQYSLTYYPTNDKHDGKWRALKIEIKTPGFAIKAKPGYRAPSD